MAAVGHLKRICKDAFSVAGAVQETCSSEMIGGQFADFLRGVAFWSTRCRYRELRLFLNGNYMETIRRFDANWSQIDRKLIVKKSTKTVIASVPFDVVFTRSSVFVDVPFCSCTGKVNFFQSFYLSWVFTAWWFRFWQGFKCEFLFDVILMEFYVCLGVNLMFLTYNTAN